MPPKHKKGTTGGLNADSVVKARAQAFNRISRRAAEIQQRAKSDRLFREKPLYERIPSLTAYDAIIKEHQIAEDDGDVSDGEEETTFVGTRTRGRPQRRKAKLMSVADTFRRFTDPFSKGIDVPASTDSPGGRFEETSLTQPSRVAHAKKRPTPRNHRGTNLTLPKIKKPSKATTTGGTPTGQQQQGTKKKNVSFPKLEPGLQKKHTKGAGFRPKTPSSVDEAKCMTSSKESKIESATSNLPAITTPTLEHVKSLPRLTKTSQGSLKHSRTKVGGSRVGLAVSGLGLPPEKSRSFLLMAAERRAKSKISHSGFVRNKESALLGEHVADRGPPLGTADKATKGNLTVVGTELGPKRSKSHLRLQTEEPKRARSKSELETEKVGAQKSRSSLKLPVVVTPAEEAVDTAPEATAVQTSTPPLHLQQASKTNLQPHPTYTGKSRFRRVVNVVRFCLRLFPHLISPIPNINPTDFQKKTIYKDSTGQALTFDVNYFKKYNKIFCGLSEAARRALAKTSDERTELDLTILQDIISKWSCLAEYNDPVKRELARMLRLFDAERHRVILREGQIGNFIYFIVSGGVRMHYTVVDSKTGSRGILPGRELRPGEFFGEQALFHQTNRTQTAVASRPSELLYLRKADLAAAVRLVEERARANRLQAMENFACFSGWSENELRVLADTSIINTYTHNQVIMGKTRGPPKQMYFLSKGRCQVVREINRGDFKNVHFESIVKLSGASGSALTSRQKKKKRKTRHYITVGELKSGNFFGVGENMEQNYVLSKGNTECLVVDAANFERRGRKEDLENMKTTRENNMPKPKQMLDQYIIRQRWAKFKEQLIEDIKRKKKIPNPTRLSDVPKALRLDPRP